MSDASFAWDAVVFCTVGGGPVGGFVGDGSRLDGGSEIALTES